MALNLVTKEAYKTYAGINSANQDALIDFLIPKISKLVKTYCRRDFLDWVNDNKIEVYNGGAPYFVLQESPVINIVLFEYSINYGASWTPLVYGTDYVLDDNMLVAISGEFPKYLRGYRVYYSAGFATTPEDLSLAIFDLIAFYIRNDGAVNSIKRTNSNTMQIEYITDTGFPSHIKRVLDQYVLDYN